MGNKPSFAQRNPFQYFSPPSFNEILINLFSLLCIMWDKTPELVSWYLFPKEWSGFVDSCFLGCTVIPETQSN